MRAADQPADPGAAFVALALRLERHAPGLVASCWADPALRARVRTEPRRPASAMVGEAAALAARVGAADLAPDRARSLLARTTALRALASRLTAPPRPRDHLEEVREAYGLQPVLGDPVVYAAASAALDAVLPGSGALRQRLSAWRAQVLCLPERVPAVVAALTEALRSRCADALPLPAGEQVTWEWDTTGRWAGASRHEGAGRTVARLSTDLPVRLSHLPRLVSHETYPGHHTAACRADEVLVRGRGWAEHAISLTATPDALVAEGAAEHALAVAVGAGWGAWAEEVCARAGARFDGPLAEAVTAALGGLARVRQDAAILLHDQGRPPAEVVAHLQRVGLYGLQRAEHAVAFLLQPGWRTYATTYAEGAPLVADWLAARPVGQGLAERYRRLLDEPLLPCDLAADLPQRSCVSAARRADTA